MAGPFVAAGRAQALRSLIGSIIAGKQSGIARQDLLEEIERRQQQQRWQRGMTERRARGEEAGQAATQDYYAFQREQARLDRERQAEADRVAEQERRQREADLARIGGVGQPMTELARPAEMMRGAGRAMPLGPMGPAMGGLASMLEGVKRPAVSPGELTAIQARLGWTPGAEARRFVLGKPEPVVGPALAESLQDFGMTDVTAETPWTSALEAEITTRLQLKGAEEEPAPTWGVLASVADRLGLKDVTPETPLEPGTLGILGLLERYTDPGRVAPAPRRPAPSVVGGMSVEESRLRQARRNALAERDGGVTITTDETGMESRRTVPGMDKESPEWAAKTAEIDDMTARINAITAGMPRAAGGSEEVQPPPPVAKQGMTLEEAMRHVKQGTSLADVEAMYDIELPGPELERGPIASIFAPRRESVAGQVAPKVAGRREFYGGGADPGDLFASLTGRRPTEEQREGIRRARAAKTSEKEIRRQFREAYGYDLPAGW